MNQLPNGWALVELDEVSDIVGGGTPRRDVKKYYENGRIPWATPTDIDPEKIETISDTKECITEDGLKESSARLLPKGTVLFSSRASIGKIAIAGREMTTNQGFANLIPTKILDSNFLSYGLRNFTNEIEKLGSGTTFKEVAKSSLKKFIFPLPPLEEQKRIVEKIRELFQESSTAQQALEKIPILMKRFRQSVLADAFSGKLVTSSDWEWVKFRNVVENLQPGFACGKRDEKGFIQLRMNNIGLNGRIVTASLLRVPRSETNIQKYRLRKGDIIFNNTNSPELVGKTILFNNEIEDCVYSNHLTRIRVNNLTLPEFVTYFLILEQRKGTFELLCRRFVGQAAVPRESLLNLDFPLPTLEEQKGIIRKIEELFSFTDHIEKTVQEAKKRVDKIDQSILAKAFRGELVPQDQNDESVSVVLERIKNQKENKKN